jgi:(4-(4-[2-(gamma-L-glutamylamino)ethyl]phenoxymethyl)furan-2-yl)methanamine synthase
VKVLALDIGGANLKAAHSAGVARSFTMGSWHDAPSLAAEIAGAIASLPAFDRLAVTMTAELCDCFATKREGVNAILDAVESAANKRGVGVWSTDGTFVHPGVARAEPLRCAAANWHALAAYLAGLFPQGLSLLVDTGSTTTDIVRLRDGRVFAAGWTDPQRLVSGELVYQGASRTPLAVLGPEIEFQGYRYGLMSEWFATTDDVYLLLGQHPEVPDKTATPDGRPRTRAAAAARIVRMIGADAEMIAPEDVETLAHVFAQAQRQRIAASILRVLEGQIPERVIIAGSGDFVAHAAVEGALPRTAVVFLRDRIGVAASHAACAFALLGLLDRA